MMAAAEEPPAGGTSGRLFQGVARNEFGFKMLQSMGWSEGKGLGASGTGITKHIAAVRRQDQIGIGADGTVDTSAKVDWCANTHTFDAILAGLQTVGATEPPARSKKEMKKDKKRDKKDKKKRDKKDKEAAPGKVVVAAPARGRPQGRYTKREAGKMVKGYSAEDLSMILGVAPGGFVAPPAVTRARSPEPEAAAARERKKRRRDADAEAPAAAAAAAPVAKARARAPSVEAEEEDEGAAPPAGWWGASMFRWAGRLGGIRRSEKKAAEGFCEDDQVAAYNEVHDHATTGKQGLGVRGAPKKVAGARWAGSKRTFGEEAEDEDDDAEQEEAREAPPVLERQPSERKVKWKKLAAAALRQLPGCAATLSALRRTLLHAAGVPDAHEAQEAAAADLARRLHASRRFEIQGDSVRLVAGLDDGEDD